ncbi:MAG: alpha/beta hydrolase [Chromatiales bacterium]
MISTGLFIVVGTVVGLSLLLYLLQDQLLFFPQPLRDYDMRRIRTEFRDVEEITLAADDGTPLHGWLKPAHDTAVAPLLIYYGGNAEEVSWLLDYQARIPGWSLLLMNYRGFGASGGKPSETGLFADALRIYDAMRARPDVDARRIALMGRSLGSAVAIYLASQRPVSGLILVTPFDSITHVAQNHYPYVPVRLLLKHPFDSLSRAHAIHRPALILAAENDTIIPPQHARALFDAWTGPKSWRLLPETDHIDISEHPDYWKRIAEFLDALR